MRDDFHKVIIERPRWGSRMRNDKTRWSTRRYDPDADPVDPSPLQLNHKAPRKFFSDRLGPLHRYLATQVGRPWRKIEGEFKMALDTRTLMGRHLWDHAVGMVELKVRMTPDGRPMNLRGDPVHHLYVHPRTGLLLRPKPDRVDEHRERQKRIASADNVVLDATTCAERQGDLWYLMIDEGRMEEALELRTNSVGRQTRVLVTRPVIRKKQANTEEVRRIRAAVEASIT